MADTNVCQYYPHWFRDILDFQYLCRTESQELHLLAEDMDRLHSNLFIQTMDEGTCAQWEAILRILPAPGETLAFRRLRVLNRLALRPPFTLAFLREKLEELFGQGNWRLEPYYPRYALLIEMFIRNPEHQVNTGIFMDILHIVKPCHIVCDMAVTAPEMEKTIYVTPVLGRCMSVIHLPELAWPDTEEGD